MTIVNEHFYHHLSAASETPLGSSIVGMLTMLGVGLLIVAVLALVFGRRGSYQYSSSGYDGTSYYDYGGSDSSWFDWSSGSDGWFSSDSSSSDFDSSGGDFGGD